MALHKEPTSEQIADQKLYREMGMTDSEYEKVLEILGRKPNYAELGIFSVMWSEHCSYKNSKPVLKRFPTKGPKVLQGPGEGAGIVDIGDKQAVVFKIESHNHPSAIEPYQGAATGVGGIIRDIFSMGARPVALLNSLRFGSLEKPRVRYLMEHVVAGIAGYGNCIGIPTVGGEVVFDDSYEGNPLVNAMCVGLIDHNRIQKGIAKGIGNPVIYVGASTGRDGIHGATFASEELNDASEEKRPSVQVGDPFMEKLLLEACLEIIDKGLVTGIQDMGAAGLTCSSAEMASKAGNGILLDLDKVPQREADMTPYEMMLSESQERMLLVCEADKVDEIIAIFDKWGLLSAVIGEVTDDKQLRLKHLGEIVASIPVDPLVEDAPVYYRESKIPAYYESFTSMKNEDLVEITDYENSFIQVLTSPTIASKEWVYRQYDHMVRTSTAVAPGSDASVILMDETRKALAMTTDGNGRYVYLDPKVGGAIAVAEAARNLVCSGAEPLAITDNLNFGNPEKPEIFWQFENACAGISEACIALDTPVIGGNVSFYNESYGKAIYPTPVIGMVGLIEDIDHITTQSFKQEGDIILLLGDSYAEILGSEYQKAVYGKTNGPAPRLDLVKEKAVQQTTLNAIRKGLVSSAHDVADGGVAIALAESAISGNIGARIEWYEDLRTDFALFGESQSRIILSAHEVNVGAIEDLAATYGVKVTRLGVVGGEQFQMVYNGRAVINMSLNRVSSLWKGELACAMK